MRRQLRWFCKHQLVLIKQLLNLFWDCSDMHIRTHSTQHHHLSNCVHVFHGSQLSARYVLDRLQLTLHTCQGDQRALMLELELLRCLVYPHRPTLLQPIHPNNHIIAAQGQYT